MSLPAQNSKTFGRPGSLVAPPPLFLSTAELSVAEHSFPGDIDTANSATVAGGESSCGSVGMVPHSPYDFSSGGGVPAGETLVFDETQIDFALEDVMVFNAASGHLFLTRPVLSDEDIKPFGFTSLLQQQQQPLVQQQQQQQQASSCYLLHPTGALYPAVVGSETPSSSVPATPAAPMAQVPAKQRKEPAREDYKTEEAFINAWTKWRRSRNSNNKSVRRCRENFRSEKKKHSTKVQELEDEQERLHVHLVSLIKELAFFNRAISEPQTLSSEDKAHLRSVIAEEMVKMEAEEAGISSV